MNQSRLLLLLATTAFLSLFSGCQSSGTDDDGQETGDEDSCVAPEGVTRPEGWGEDTHCKGVAANYDLVFDDTVVQRLDITISADDYQDSQNNLDDILGGSGGGGGGLDDTEEPIYVPVDVDYNGHTWWDVGMRYKGNSSLHSAYRQGTKKYAFRFNFDKYEKENPDVTNQRFYGFKKMTFSSGFKDDSLLRDKVAADIFRDAGVPAAHGAFVRVYVDYGEGSIYFGLYTMIEDPSDEMLQTQFASDEGNLYKPEGRGADWTEFSEEGFEKKTNEDAADWSDIIASVDALHASRSDAVQWRAGLEQVFDVDAFLRCLAVNQVIVNWDSYGMMDHNYYVYSDPSNGGRVVWFPWDLNEAMLTQGPGNSEVARSIMLDSVTGQWPLIRYILDDDVYRDRYKEHVQAVLDGAFALEAVQEKLDRYHDLIAPYVTGTESKEAAPYTFLNSEQAFNISVSGSNGLKAHVERQHDEATQALQNDNK